MADVTGPIATLPGAHHPLPDGSMCDNHPDRPATARVQGETDSMGCEMWDLCDECRAELRAQMRAPEARTGECDWCHQRATDLRNRRDIDEGMYGRVYRICGDCAKRYDAELEREAREWDERHGYADDDY
jgi:hypothetical protein